jgi:cold shock CspA family protein
MRLAKTVICTSGIQKIRSGLKNVDCAFDMQNRISSSTPGNSYATARTVTRQKMNKSSNRSPDLFVYYSSIRVEGFKSQAESACVTFEFEQGAKSPSVAYTEYQERYLIFGVIQ